MKYTRLLLSVLWYASAFCQTPAIAQQQLLARDSLKENILRAKNDSLRIEALYEYMRANLNNNTSDFEPYVKKMIALSKKIKYNWGLTTAYILSLSYYKNTGNYELALKNGDSAEVILENASDTNLVLNKGHLYTNRGNLYYSIGDYQKAIDDYFRAEKILKQQKFPALASVYSSIAGCFSHLSNDHKALEFDDRAINTARQFSDQRLLATVLMNKATRLMNLDNFRSADSILQVVWPIVEKLQNTKSLFAYHFNKGDIEAYYKKDTLTALTHYHKSYSYAKENEDVWQMTQALTPLAQFKIDIQQPNAIKYIRELDTLAQKYEMIGQRSDAMKLYAAWYAMQGNYKKAYEYQQQFKQLSDSINSEESREKISMMEVRFRVDNKDQEIERLKTQDQLSKLSIRQKNTLNYILIGGATALIIILLLGYRNYTHRQKLQQQRIAELETEKQLLATQSLLKGQEDERSRMAKDLHDGLGGMLSGVKLQLGAMKGNLILTGETSVLFNNALDKLDESISEMRRVAHNMMPEALIKLGLQQALQDYCEGISTSRTLTVNTEFYGLEQRMDAATEVTIYRIVQELVNNAVKHAHAFNVLVQVMRQGELLSITVEDNGKGFDTSQWQDKSTAGLLNIQSRVSYLRGRMDIKSQPDSGTSVYIECTIDNNE